VADHIERHGYFGAPCPTWPSGSPPGRGNRTLPVRRGGVACQHGPRCRQTGEKAVLGIRHTERLRSPRW